MRIINQQTKADFANIAAISFKMDGVNIKGMIEVQKNETPPDGVYSVPDLNGALIHVKNTPPSINEWLEFDLVVPATTIQKNVWKKWYGKVENIVTVIFIIGICVLVGYCQICTKQKQALEIELKERADAQKEREDALKEVNELENDL
jgi:hypothetical protein